ncbi:MAG: amidohydrolase [Kosmotogaceae bacterium]|nr:amidohydrolase [Kosmotogaceae bacterium]
MDLARIRHDLHEIPEIGFNEFKTQAYIMSLMDRLSVPYEKVAGTGILVKWKKTEGPFVLFRADMDALPVFEETDAPFKSAHEGFMHACGHDVHMTILIGLIERIVTSDLNRNFLFLFQPAEEGGGGAEKCLSKLEQYEITEAWALHVNDEFPEGSVHTRAGVLFASAFETDCTFKGRSAHVAFYKRGRDAIEGAMDFLRRVYSVDRGDSVLRFGLIHGGRVRNVVADSCTLSGTVRTKAFEISEKAIMELEKLGIEVASERGLKFSQEIGSKYPQVHVDGDLYDKLCSLIDVSPVEMKYVGEDFGVIAMNYPSVLFWLGTGRGEQHGLHNSRFLPADSVIEKGVEIFWKIANN